MDDFVYGFNPVTEALNGGGRKPLELLVESAPPSARTEQIRGLAQQQGVPVREVSRRQLDRLAVDMRHQGVLLRLPPFNYLSLEELLRRWRASGSSAFFLVLDGVTDPHNFGALIRSAEVAGCQGVIVAKDRACPVTPVVEKAAAGALAHLPVCQVTNLSRTLDEFKAAGIWCYGLAGDEGADDLFTTPLKGDLALVVGSEGKGLRPNVRKHCDRLLAIPMRGRIGSLNASVAAGIALFEVVRQGHTSAH